MYTYVITFRAIPRNISEEVFQSIPDFQIDIRFLQYAKKSLNYRKNCRLVKYWGGLPIPHTERL